jgi:hypothetical protein
MDVQKTETGIGGRYTSPDQAAGEAALPVARGLPRGASEALADPIVRALMAANRVDPNAVEQLLRRVALRLARGLAVALALVAGVAAAHPANLEFEITLFDEGAPLHPGDQLFLADQLSTLCTEHRNDPLA